LKLNFSKNLTELFKSHTANYMPPTTILAWVDGEKNKNFERKKKKKNMKRKEKKK